MTVQAPLLPDPETLPVDGGHSIGGKWTPVSERDATFRAMAPAQQHLLPTVFAEATEQDVDRAARAAAEAARRFAATSREQRALFLEAIAAELEARGPALTALAHAETALPVARLEGERGRTTGQLRFFATRLRDGTDFPLIHTPGNPARTPLPQPDLRITYRPLGPVAVFGASNFPLAFSVAGGDTASALAAGCPVIVKAHAAHPGTSALAAEAVMAAVRTCGLPAGVFSLLQGRGFSGGQALVRHPAVQAVGFTGSLRGGRSLFDLAMTRPQPIPFYGELGSCNPVILLPGALAARGDSLATQWAASLTQGVGQFCTNPGIILAVDGPDLSRFTEQAVTALRPVPAAPMLTGWIARAYQDSLTALAAVPGVSCLLPAAAMTPAEAAPAVFRVSSDTWRHQSRLHAETFGPAAIIVACRDLADLTAVLEDLDGQLTITLHLEDSAETDRTAAATLLPVCSEKAGRVLFNGMPTGVEVSPAMVHGGPYPASTASATTSVGGLAVQRFLRPVSYQDCPAFLSPPGSP
ncbi:aldehyde dehydrogenase (NADP(+)) [Novispirillum itersonii]|uniref:NADP-dependent aldehyde dehydrogenase n=1 Tax=Novispirillum itersonii TaxID=189 RepID=A0A7W9ZHU1_NOVIT|nr:aldehyde dehydrogenase (NADP(+)) [Novispirillum itersonii]MBB6211333.1 NADP-dependent aldehyde dehydrogenase [Novispirillum itersonii]